MESITQRFGIKLLVISIGAMREDGGARKKIQDYSYLLSEHIGKGYSSHVYRGRNDGTEQRVAIKVIDMKKINNEVHRNLLASEMEVLRLLKHSDHILDLYQIYTTKNNTYIVTELCEGGDLAKYIASRRTLPEADAIPLMNDIIQGYSAMQQRGIIHRDLKPANIFLKQGIPKLADFGFAMKQSESKKYSSYNVGSPVYMPPEALNDNKYSFKSDIWALGVIYYEMLTGKTPWRAKTEKELGRLLLSVPIKKLMPPSISASSEQFLKSTLTVDVNHRMSPGELEGVVLSQDRSNIPRALHSTEHDLFDTRNNKIRRSDRQETSLGKPIQTPSTYKRLTMLQTKDSFNATNKFTLPKTATSVNSGPRTQHTITGVGESSKMIQEGCGFRDISTHHLIGEAGVDRKYLSKQLLSQIHFCRFIYKLISRMGKYLGEDLNHQLLSLKEHMCGLLFDKLQAVQDLRVLSSMQAQDFRQSAQFSKIKQILSQYFLKYRKELGGYREMVRPLPAVKEQLTRSIASLYEGVQGREGEEWKEQVIVLDYLVTLRQLVGIMFNNDLQGFHIKSKIETIVEGTPSNNIGQQHLSAIANKLRAIKIL